MKKTLVTICMILFIFLLILLFFIIGAKDPIYISIAAPFSGKDQDIGKSIYQGVKLYVDLINENGGIDGASIKLKLFDDKNQPTTAVEQAKCIVSENISFAVIGHGSTRCSINAAPFYKENKIPSFSVGSSSVLVTKFNDYTFSLDTNDHKQGMFLADYANIVLNQHNINIIFTNDSHNAYIATVFEAKSKRNGVSTHVVRNIFHDNNMVKFVDELENLSGLIFIAAPVSESISIVKLLKDKGINNPLMISNYDNTELFTQGFDINEKENKITGYYTNGIYISPPVIFDIASKKAQLFNKEYQDKYHNPPNWIAAYAHDSAIVLTEAIKRSLKKSTTNDITEIREQIKMEINDIDSIYKAINGVTGLNYLDRHGAVNKVNSVGIFKNNEIVPAYIQVQAISDINSIPQLDTAIKEGQIFRLSYGYYKKVHVVYTGIKIKEIKNFDHTDLTVEMDFNLWFRYQGDIEPQQIEFLNSAIPLELSFKTHSSLNDTTEQLNRNGSNHQYGVKEIYIEKNNLIKYRLFRVKGIFKVDFIPDAKVFGRNIIGVNFKHQTLLASELVYVADSLGMKVSENKSIDDKFYLTQLSQLGWIFENEKFVHDIMDDMTMGTLKHGNQEKVQYSRFNYYIQIKQEVVLSKFIPIEKICDILTIQLIIFVLFVYSFSIFFIDKKYKFILFVINLSVAIIVFLFLYIGLFDILLYSVSHNVLYFYQKLIDITFWLFSAYFVDKFFRLFIWKLIVNKWQTAPQIIMNFVTIFVFISSCCAIIAFSFNYVSAALWTILSTIIMMIGTAIINNLSNIISGLIIFLDSPFKIGDKVKINKLEGIVKNISWRATNVENANGLNDCIIIPNHIITNSIVYRNLEGKK